MIDLNEVGAKPWDDEKIDKTVYSSYLPIRTGNEGVYNYAIEPKDEDKLRKFFD